MIKKILYLGLMSIVSSSSLLAMEQSREMATMPYDQYLEWLNSKPELRSQHHLDRDLEDIGREFFSGLERKPKIPLTKKGEKFVEYMRLRFKPRSISVFAPKEDLPPLQEALEEALDQTHNVDNEKINTIINSVDSELLQKMKTASEAYLKAYWSQELKPSASMNKDTLGSLQKNTEKELKEARAAINSLAEAEDLHTDLARGEINKDATADRIIQYHDAITAREARETFKLFAEKIIQAKPQEFERLDSFGNSILHLLARKDKGHFFAILDQIAPQQLHAFINQKNDEGRTPLQVAAASANFPFVEKLLSWKDVLIDERDNEGKTALYLAVDAHQEDIAAYLVDKGANRCIQGPEGLPVMIALLRGWPLRSIKLLLENKDGALACGDLNERADERGNTLLHAAVIGDTISTIAYLVERGAHLVANDDGITPLTIAYKMHANARQAVEERTGLPGAYEEAVENGARAEEIVNLLSKKLL